MTDEELVQVLETATDAELDSTIYELDGDGPTAGPAYAHQRIGLERIERGANQTPPVSGILHYPTGAGKTRVGMELMARALKQNRKHRFIWATYSRNLIRQTMVRMAELAGLFPRGTTFAWIDADDAKEAEDDIDIVFMTRSMLTKALDKAGDWRVKHGWQQQMINGNPLTLIYDECHQLGAPKLQKSLRKFYVSGIPRNHWRVVGLSATPVPTRLEAHPLLQEHVFPRRSDSTSHTWPFHVFQRIQNEALIKQGVLCPINTYIDQQGEFDLPPDLLRRMIGDARLKPPGPEADEMVVHQYSLQFNRDVMAAPPIVTFLADRIGKSIGFLGKTIVFVPNIEAANRMAGLLYDGFPSLRGRVAAVHSRMRDLRVPGQGEASVHEILNKFRRLDNQPSILVNVDMLTEGFDDPRVRTVVLARLTLSTNRFWQMIGRGTRGPATRPPGTVDCNVIDPVKLTRLYDYFAGYQPSFLSDAEVEFEELDEKGGGQDAVSPVVPHVVRPPDPATGAYEVDPELERVQARVALALRHFLAGSPLSETEAVDAARTANVSVSGGRVLLVPSNEPFASDTAVALLLGEVCSLEHRTGFDLAWFRQAVPFAVDEAQLRRQIRELRAIETLGLGTQKAFEDARTHGEFLALMQQEVADTPARARTPTAVVGPPVDADALGNAEQVVLDAALAVAGADGQVVDVEISAIVDTLRRMFGRAPTPGVEKAVRARAVPASVPVERVEALLPPDQRQLLLWQMTEIAVADAIVTPEERAMLHGFAERLRIPVPYVESLLGAQLARADIQAGVSRVAPSIRCMSCGSDTPSAGAFCTSCGTRLRPVEQGAPLAVIHPVVSSTPSGGCPYCGAEERFVCVLAGRRHCVKCGRKHDA